MSHVTPRIPGERDRWSIRVATGIFAALLSATAAADWTFTLQHPGGASSCPLIAEPFIYYADTCEFVALRNNPSSAQGRERLWADQLVLGTVSRTPLATCSRTYANYLWIDNRIYPLSASVIVQHNRPYLTAFSKTLSGCTRPGGQPVVQTGPQRLLLANIDLATTGTASWTYDNTANRAYLRVNTTTGDVTCSGGSAPPSISNVIFANGFE